MALLVAVAGGIIGSFFGMPQLGFLAGSLLGSLLFPSKTRGGPKLSNTHVTASTYGSPIQLGWGTCRIGGNIIQAGDLVQHSHHQGKGLGGGASYTYSWTGAVGLCSTEFTGPIQKVLKIWADTKLVYDATGQSGVTQNIPGNGGGKGGGTHGAGHPVVNGNVTSAFNKLGSFRVYTGTQDQLPDAALEALPNIGAANALAYRGLAYIVFDDIDLENFGNRVPNFTFEVAFNNDDIPFSQNAFKFDFDNSVVGAIGTQNGVAVDVFRQRAYFVTLGNTPPGIHVMDLKTGDQIGAHTFAEIGASFGTDTCIIGNDGYLYAWAGGANYGPMLKIDVDAWRVVGSIGTANPFMSIDGSTTTPSYMVPLKLGYANCLLVAGQVFKDLHLYNMDANAQLSEGTYSESNMHIVGGNQIDNDNAMVFGLGIPTIGGGTTSPFNIYQIPVPADPITPFLLRALYPADVDSEWSHFTGASYFVFDSTDGNVMFFVSSSDSVTTGHHQRYLVKISGTTGDIVWKAAYPGGGLPGNPDTGANQTIISNGIFSTIDSSTHSVYTYSTQDGSLTTNVWDSSLTGNYQAWVDSLGAILFKGNYTPIGLSNNFGVLVTNASANARPLSVIVSDICHIVGLQDADLDVSALTDEVPGYLVTDQMIARNALMPLGIGYLFDGVESDDILKFVKRGAAPITTIPATDLTPLDTKTNQLINEMRSQEVDLPRTLQINFLDPNQNYQQATQYSKRASQPWPTMFSSNTTTIDLPIVEEPGFMKQLAEKLLFTTWIERVTFKVKLPWNYLVYDPTDVLTLTSTDGAQTDVRMANVTTGADLTTEWQAVSQSTTTYNSAAATDGGQGFFQQILGVTPPTKLFLFDMPLLRDSDDTGQSFTILYDAESSYADNWPGGSLLTSFDDTSYTHKQDFAATMEASWGVVTNALGDTTEPFSPDYDNTINVVMVQGGTNLSSATMLEVCNGANAAALFNTATGVIEIIQFQTVTTETDGSFTLSGLLRGRRGTEIFTGAHVSGETFFLLTEATMQTINMALGDLNTPRFYKAPSLGVLHESVDPVKFTDTGRAWKPYAPVQLSATLVGSDIDLAWVRRTRVGGELMDFTGIVPLAEQSEIYEVDIYNALGDTVLRTIRVEYGATPTTSPGATYLAADIATDFGSTPSDLNIAVYQVSTVIGRGFGKLTNVTVM